MLDPYLLSRVRKIELRTRRLVQNAFAGAYRSTYKGRGMAFSSVRPYIPGDDVRTIDWKVTARTGQPYIKQYVEERELSLMIVIDGSASVLFGTQEQQKRDFAAELAAVLAYAAIYNNDRAGLLIFSDRVERVIPPRKGRKHVMHLIHDLLTFEPSGRGTDLSAALQTTGRILLPGSIVFLLSDFLLPKQAQDYSDLGYIARKHEVAAVMLSDPLEERFPQAGLIGLEDAETGEIRYVDTRSERWRQEFEGQSRLHRQNREMMLSRAGVARMELPADGDYVYALNQFFQEQSRIRAR